MEMVRSEMAACGFQDVLIGEWFVNWVVRVDSFEPISNNILDAWVESFEEGRVEVCLSDPSGCKKGAGNSQEIPVIV
jgi:hypothetical protein